MTRITKNTVFDSPLLRRLIQGGINLFLPQPRDERTPVSRALLIHLLSQRIRPTETLALNAAFALAFAVFLRMGEFTYPATALVDRNRSAWSISLYRASPWARTTSSLSCHVAKPITTQATDSARERTIGRYDNVRERRYSNVLIMADTMSMTATSNGSLASYKTTRARSSIYPSARRGRCEGADAVLAAVGNCEAR